MMDTWVWYWIAWAVSVAGTFAVLEGIALKDDVPANTLSGVLWMVLRAEGRLRPYRWLIRAAFVFVFVIFPGWLATHVFSFGWI